MNKAWRFRTNFQGKLILQRCTSFSYLNQMIKSDLTGRWLDATTEDLLIYAEECLNSQIKGVSDVI